MIVVITIIFIVTLVIVMSSLYWRAKNKERNQMSVMVIKYQIARAEIKAETFKENFATSSEYSITLKLALLSRQVNYLTAVLSN